MNSRGVVSGPACSLLIPTARVLLMAAVMALSASPADSALEEFENWSVGARELDDENGLDELLRSFSPWEDWRWRENLQGARVGMGCATTQFWEMNLQVKLWHRVSDRVLVGFRSWQQEQLGESVGWNEFSGGFRPAGRWWVGGTYRPAFDKQQHDAGLFVGYMRDHMSWFRLHLGFEDILNNFWDERTRYIQDKSRRVYVTQPHELEASGVWRETGLGAVAVRAVALPRYHRSLEPAPDDADGARETQLVGWLLRADLVSDPLRRTLLGLRGQLKGTDRTETVRHEQAVGDDFRLDDARLRDLWLQPWAEHRLSERWRLRVIGQGRWSSESHNDGDREHRIEVRQLGGMGTVIWSLRRFLDISLGLAAEVVRVDQDAGAEYAYFTHGDRGESRAVIALDLHWNGARMVLIESLEGDDEGYQTTGYHDKGFAHLVIEF